MHKYDSILFVSFGGPEGMDDVMPFLANVLRGKNVPESRMRAVAHHYELFGGVSPINGQNRALIESLKQELHARQIDLPIYWGNRNWHPMLTDTVKRMKADGVKDPLVFFTSAYSSYSGCRQYLQDLDRAKAEAEYDDLQVHKLRAFFNHPYFIKANKEQMQLKLAELTPAEKLPGSLAVAYTAHSIPDAMASKCQYQAQLNEAARLVSQDLGLPDDDYQVVFQSRSGPPTQPWLGPDICDHLRDLASRGYKCVLVHPIGFVSDHMEVIYDLDHEALQVAQECGIKMLRSPAAGTHSLFAKMMGELVYERLSSKDRPVVGCMPPLPDQCPADCCQYP